MTDWLAGNWIALVALVVSIGLAGIRFSEWWQARHRVHVECKSMTLGIPSKIGGGTSNRSYVAITVTTEGRPIAISRIGFELLGDAPDPSQGPQMGSVNELAGSSTAGYPPTGFGNPVNLADGSSQTWVASLDVPPFDYSPVKGYSFRAKVQLTNGKCFWSDPFWHIPSPISGFSEEELRSGRGGQP